MSTPAKTFACRACRSTWLRWGRDGAGRAVKLELDGREHDDIRCRELARPQDPSPTARP